MQSQGIGMGAQALPASNKRLKSTSPVITLRVQYGQQIQIQYKSTPTTVRVWGVQPQVGVETRIGWWGRRTSGRHRRTRPDEYRLVG